MVRLCPGILALFLVLVLPSVTECLEEHPFGPGEKLVFRVIYLAAPAGIATLEVGEISEVDGTAVYRFLATANSSTLFSLFYRVKDRIESFVDVRNLEPVRFEKHLREGRSYRNDEITIFDRMRNVARTEDREMEIPPGVQDSLSSLYYLRTQTLEVGQTVSINVNADEKNYCVEVKVLREETVRKWGRNVKTVVVQPILRDVRLGGILKEKGNVLIWLTDDEKRIPVFITAKVAFGHLSFVLIDYQPD